MECLLKSIFSRFGWILEAKLGCKIHPNRFDLVWRGVMARRGEAWRGEAWRCDGSARAWRGEVRGVALLKGVYRYEMYPPCVLAWKIVCATRGIFWKIVSIRRRVLEPTRRGLWKIFFIRRRGFERTSTQI